MIALILFIVFGLLFSFFAVLNTEQVTVYFGFQTLSHIPMFVLVLTSVGLGVLFATLFYSLKSFSSRFAMGKKEEELSRTKKEVVDLTKRLHQVELENSRLRGKSGEDTEDENSI